MISATNFGQFKVVQLILAADVVAIRAMICILSIAAQLYRTNRYTDLELERFWLPVRVV
jgi:hypothetical protein